MSYHVTHRVQCAPGSTLELENVRRKVADHVLFTGFRRVPLFALTHILRGREHLVQNFGDLLIGDGLVRHLVGVHSQLVHVLIRHVQAHPRLLELGLNVAGMPDRPRTLCTVQCDVQSVVANHPDRRHTHADIDSLVSLHSLDYVVVVKPKKAGGSRKGYRASMDKMTSVLRSMRYKEVIRDGLFHDANEGMYVGYMETRTVPVDDRLALTDLDIQGITEINSAGVNCVVISLPVEYTRIIGRRNNCYEVAFDLRYFSAMTEGDRKRKLQGFPRQIQEGWRRYSNGEFPDGACWQRLDWRKTIVTKIKSGQNDPYGVPFAVAALDDIDYAKYFINTKRRVLDTVNNQIYYETFPEGKDKGTSALSQSQQENQHNTVKQALTQRSNTNGVSFFSLASGTKMDRLPVDLSLLNEENENAIKEDVNEDIGVAAAALSGSSTGNYATATLNMEIVANNVFTWIEALVEELNKCLNYNVIRDGSYRVEFRVLPITFVNREKQVKFFSDLYARGKGSLMAWIASTGFDVDDYLSLMDLELDEDFENKYPVHKTSFTVTGKDAPDGDVDKSTGGDPPVNSSTESTKANNANASPSPSG